MYNEEQYSFKRSFPNFLLSFKCALHFFHTSEEEFVQ